MDDPIKFTSEVLRDIMDSDGFIAWLLQSKTPSIRYLALVNLASAPDNEIQPAFREVSESGPVPAILANQSPTGAWEVDRTYYTPKFRSTHWSMLLLAELATSPEYPGFRRGAQFMLESVLDRPLWWLEERRGITCFWGNLLRYTLLAGIRDDLRLNAVIGILVDSALRDSWGCRYNHGYPCAWGAGRTLWGLAALPPMLRSSQTDALLQSSLAFLLDENHLALADYPVPGKGRVSKLWSQLSFPLFYQADILLVLRALTELGELQHTGAADAIEWLKQKRSASGRWRGSSPYSQRTWPLGDAEDTDRWVSLQAAIVLSRA
jgi:hypothetical protein